MSISSKAAYFARTAFGGMWRAPFVHTTAIAALSLALLGFAVARVAGHEVQALISTLGGEVELTVYLKPDASSEDAQKLLAALEQRSGGKGRLVSPAEALGRLAQQLGEQGRGLTDLTENPLPWTIEVTVPPNARTPEALGELAAKARALEFVDSVDYGKEALERLSTFARGLQLASAVAFILVFLTTIVVVSATLQLAIYARREEIEIQKLVGATNRFVRAPFLLEGLLQGVLAALFSFGVLAALEQWVGPKAREVVSLLPSSGTRAVTPRLLSEMLALGVTLGLAGSTLAVRRFLRT